MREKDIPPSEISEEEPLISSLTSVTTVYENSEIKLTGIPGADGYIRIYIEGGASIAVELKDARNLASRIIAMVGVM
jgi:hypothetical protein